MQHTRRESRLPDCDFRYFHFIPPILCHNAVHNYPSFPRLKSPPRHPIYLAETGLANFRQHKFISIALVPPSQIFFGDTICPVRPSVIGGLPRPPLRALFSPPPSREETKERLERSYPPSLPPSIFFFSKACTFSSPSSRDKTPPKE